MQDPQENRQLLTIREFCAIYGVDSSTVRKRIKNGQIKGFRKPGGRVILVLDPGWQEVILSETSPKGSTFDPDDVYIFRGVEAAKFLGITPRSVRRMAMDGRLGSAKIGTTTRNRRYSINNLRRGLVTVQKGSFQEKRPSGAKVRKAVMEWGYKRLGIEPPTD